MPEFPTPFASEARGVGSDDEHPPAEMRGTNGSRRYNTPFRIEPQLGKVREDFGKSERDMPEDVLQDDDARS